MDADSLHMTLLFLGEVKRTRLLQLMQTADKVSVPPFEFILERLSFWQHNRIAYATTLVEVPALLQLVTSLQQEVLAAGFLFESDVESHEFAPHVTLLRNVRHVLESQAITPVTWWADSFVLVESVMTDQGARYHVLQKWRLPPFDQTSSVEPHFNGHT